MKIKDIKTRDILNSAGKKTIEVEIISENNIRAIASSPSAIIPGKREVLMSKNISSKKVKEIFLEICNKNINSQKDFDIVLKKYMNILGTKISLPLSLAFARIMANSQDLSLVKYIRNLANYSEESKSSIPLVTIFSGGVHNEKDSIQNIMIAVNIHPFSETIQVITDIYSYIENQLKEKNILKSYGSSSGMIVEDLSIDEKFEMLLNTIKTLNYEKCVSIAIDVAAEHFYENGVYLYRGKNINSKTLNEILSKYIEKYNITYIEDPFDSRDQEYWRKMKLEYKNIDIVGDDLFATQYKYINNELANGIIIKMNQVGTLTETIETFVKARDLNMSTCVSHRSIETEDTFMCDLAFALSAKYVKIGGPRRGDRIIKYNRLLRLEDSEFVI